MQPTKGVPISSITGVPGWETEAEERALLSLAKLVPAGGKIVELGAEYGRSSAIFCTGARSNVTIASFDLFPTDHPEVGDLLAAYKDNLSEAGFEGRTQVVRFDSAKAGEMWQFGEIDLLFVDADHTYEGVKRDIAAWLPQVRRGGVIAFHDCANGEDSHPLHFEVARAVDEALDKREWDQVWQVDSLRVFERRL